MVISSLSNLFDWMVLLYTYLERNYVSDPWSPVWSFSNIPLDFPIHFRGDTQPKYIDSS